MGSKYTPCFEQEEMELKAAIFQSRIEWFLPLGLLKEYRDRRNESVVVWTKSQNIHNLLGTVRKNSTWAVPRWDKRLHREVLFFMGAAVLSSGVAEDCWATGLKTQSVESVTALIPVLTRDHINYIWALIIVGFKLKRQIAFIDVKNLPWC